MRSYSSEGSKTYWHEERFCRYELFPDNGSVIDLVTAAERQQGWPDQDQPLNQP